ncbi:MAG: hypothetical protein M1363_07975 [Gammaproteobacteria bacterium]|nr:hypothetical protein [Gammaproteobacteria bacterium]
MMSHLFDAVLFTGLVAAAGLGIAYLIVGFLPAPESNEEHANVKYRIENFFFGIGGIVIALVLWLGIIFNS